MDHCISRRGFIRGGAATAALLSAPVLKTWGTNRQPSAGDHGPAHRIFSLDQDWLFGGVDSATLQSGSEGAFSRITLPHCVVPLSWQNWDPATWEDVWIYRRHFTLPPELKGLRLFLHFDRVMAGATPSVNGHALPQHLGGFLPFEYEITSLVKEQDNVLSVAVDGGWLNVPPSGSPKGPESIDYLLPAGICGSVSLRAVPSIFISDVFAKPVDVLDAKKRRLEITCRIDAGAAAPASVLLVANLRDKDHTVASVSKNVESEKRRRS